MKKKFNLFTMAVLFAAVFIFSAGTDVLAAEIPSSAITVDYEHQQLIIHESGKDTDLQIYFSVPTIKNVKKKNASGVTEKYKVMTSTAWDIYDYDKTDGVVIDLSWLNVKKDNYIQIKGNKKSDPVTIKIPAVLTKVSASFDAAASVVTLKDTTNKKQPVIIADQSVEYKTQYGDWLVYDAVEGGLAMYQVRGAALRFRLAPHKSETLNLTDSAPDVSDMVDPDWNQIEVYETGNFPGVELKVAVKKQAAGPKFTIDYGKHQFNLPKNTQYRVVSQKGIGTWTSVGDAAKKLNLSEIAADIEGSSAVLEVRTEASASKPYSVSRREAFDMPAVLTVYTTQNNITPDQIGDHDIFYNGVGVDVDSAEIYAGYKYKQATKAFEDLILFNASSDTYEVFVSKDGEEPAPDAKIFTVLPKPKNKEDDRETYISAKNVKNGDKIYIRKKADTKNKVWSSYFVELGTVAYDPNRMP